MVDIYSFCKKKLLWIIFIFFLGGCATVPKKIIWQDATEVAMNSFKLKTGDIIVKNKLWNEPISWGGHCGVMINNFEIGDYPKIGINFYSLPSYDWLMERGRKVVVLRYDKFNDKFKKYFEKNAIEYSKGTYLLTLNKFSTNHFYCSKYVWFLYYKTGQDMGYNLNIDSDGGYIIFPYDFLNSKELHQVLI